MSEQQFVFRNGLFTAQRIFNVTIKYVYLSKFFPSTAKINFIYNANLLTF